VRRHVEAFGGDVERLELPPGLSVLGILETVQADPVLRVHCHVTIGDHLIPREAWARVYPKAGAELAVSVMPANGQTALRAVLLVAVAVAAIAAPYAAVGAGASATTFGAGTFGGALLAAGMPTVGYLAVNTLSPPAGAVGT
jgi:hypothetical protein